MLLMHHVYNVHIIYIYMYNYIGNTLYINMCDIHLICLIAATLLSKMLQQHIRTESFPSIHPTNAPKGLLFLHHRR